MNIMDQKPRHWNCLSWRVGLANPPLKDTYISPGHMKGYVLRARVAREKVIYWQSEMRETLLRCPGT